MAYAYKWKFDRPAEREVYMALADHADEDGRDIRPAVALVAWKVDLGERTVRNHITALVAKGILVKDTDGNSAEQPDTYHIDATKAVPKEPLSPFGLRAGRRVRQSDVRRLLKSQKGLCYYCRARMGDAYTMDHVVPVSRGGSNSPENLVLACRSCNSRKGTRLPHEWPEGGRLI